MVVGGAPGMCNDGGQVVRGGREKKEGGREVNMYKSALLSNLQV